MSKIKVQNYHQAFRATGEFLAERFATLQIEITSAHDKLAAFGGRVTRLERNVSTLIDKDYARDHSGDPGNYLHRINQVEQDIRELRIAIHEEEHEATRVAVSLGHAIAELHERINRIGAHDNSGTDSGADCKPSESSSRASGFAGSAGEH